MTPTDKAELREGALKFLREYPRPKCLGYPQCDGNLPGEPHEDCCPMKDNKEPQPKPADIMAAFAESEALLARKELVTARVRLEICAGRMRGCNEHISEMQETHAIPELQPQHELIEEVEAWIADMKDKE